MHAKLVLALLPFLALSSPIRRQNNLQSFAGAVGGEAATPVEDSGNADRPFQVGQDTFVNLGAALQRSCDQQFNRCANLANGGDETVTVADCTAQKEQCGAAGDGANADAGAGAGAGTGAAAADAQGNGAATDAGNDSGAATNANHNAAVLLAMPTGLPETRPTTPPQLSTAVKRVLVSKRPLCS